jgi:hypothetical protein
MKNFDDFMLHRVDTLPQAQGFSMEMGGGYSFATDGKHPLVNKLRLLFVGYKWYVQADGETTDFETNRRINNLGALWNFYKEHKTHKRFVYNHPFEGHMEVRFDQPLRIPPGRPGGNGVSEDFEVNLIQVI